MRIVLVNDVSEASGGATAVFIRCIEAARNAGIDVAVLVGDSGNALRERFEGLRVVALDQRPLRAGVTASDLFAKSYNRAARRLLQSLLDEGGDDTVVHVHGFMQVLSPSIFAALNRIGRRLIVTAHDFFLDCPNGGFVNYRNSSICRCRGLSAGCIVSHCDKRNYLHKLWRLQRSAIQRFAGSPAWPETTVILAHEAMAPFLAHRQFGRVVTLRSPTDAFVPKPVDVPANHRVAFLGRMTWEKGVDLLAEAIATIGCEADLMGKGPLLDLVRSRAPHANCPGWTATEHLAENITRARLFVMPSRMVEPYGLVAVEAMMSGLPLVISDHCLIAGEVAALGAGIVYPANDTGALTAAITRLLADDTLAASMGAAAYAAGQRFAPAPADWQHRMIAIYEQTAERGAARASHDDDNAQSRSVARNAAQQDAPASTGAE